MFIRILKSFCDDSSIHGFKYLTEKRSKNISKIFWAAAIISSIACTSILLKSFIDEYARNSIIITRDNEEAKVTEIPFPAFSFCLPVRTGVDEPFDDLFREGKFDHRQHVGDDWTIMGLWLEKYVFEITYMVTKFGFCRTFNILRPEDFFNTSAVDKIFSEPFNRKILSFSDDDSPDPELWNETKPFKTAHKDLGVFAATYDTLELLDTQPSRQEYHLILHAPHELPSEFSQQFIISELDILLFRVTPQLTTIDESLTRLESEERQCYLEGEEVLKMFKIYSFENCRSECLAEFIAQRCECIPFYMIRNLSASICKSSQIACYEDAQELFLQHEEKDCHCYPPCTQLKYSFEKEKTGFTEATSVFNFHKFTSTSFSIRFKDGEFYPQVKSKQYTIVDIFAFVGGYLGLFLGMSVLSVVEVFYLLLVRPFTRAKEPDETNSANPQTTNYFLNYLKSSSIHSFNHIGDSGRNFLERAAWVALFVLSLAGCSLMAGQLQDKVKINSITMIIEDKSHENSEIPFPAITFFGSHLNSEEMFYYSEDGEMLDEWLSRNEYYNDPKNVIQAIAGSNVEATTVSMYRVWKNIMKTNNMSELDGYESQIVAAIRRRSKFDWFRSQNGSFCTHFGVPTAEILTSRGFGFAFNILEAGELYFEDQISNDFKYERHDDDLPNFSGKFPWSTSSGCADSLEMKLNMKAVKNRANILFYSEAFFIHAPDDLPLFMAREHAYEIEPGKLFEVLITPDVITIDDDLKALSYEDRLCFVEGERQLRFFKVYTKHNCEVECLSNRSIEACGCVPFDVIRDAGTQVCGVDKATCIDKVKYELKFSNNNDKIESCRCLVTCDSVVYNYETIETKFRETNTNEALLIFKFKDSEYSSMRRVRQFTMVDFCSYVGGLLGLFAGFSVLSLCELFYFFTLRLFSNLMLMRRRPAHKIIQVRPRAPQSSDNSEIGNSSVESASARPSTSLIELTNDIHARPHPIICPPASLNSRPGKEYFGPVVCGLSEITEGNWPSRIDEAVMEDCCNNMKVGQGSDSISRKF